MSCRIDDKESRNLREVRASNGDGTFTTFYEPARGGTRLLYDSSKVVALTLGLIGAVIGVAEGYVAEKLIARERMSYRRSHISPF